MATVPAESVIARRAPMRFSKMHGAGNDFVVVDLRGGAIAITPALSRALSERHTGVGCDQVLTIHAARSAQAIASYRIWNADGSQAQQCGNGARCIAAWLVRDGSARETTFLLDSPAGTHAVQRMADDCYRIALGVPQFAPQALPLAGFDVEQDEYALVLRQAQDERGSEVRFGVASMGNPHALIEVDDIARAPVATLGPGLQAHAAFPESVNVGFAQIVARDHIRLRVYERGAGETLACGSGACAAAAILMRRGRIDRDVLVSLPGGDLQIGWQDDIAPLTMAGPAAFVFEGEFS